MNFCVTGDQLRKALADIDVAEKNGFQYCLAVFDITQAGKRIDECRAEYSDLIEKAHPTNAQFDWGRFQRVTKRNKFVKGKLVPITAGQHP